MKYYQSKNYKQRFKIKELLYKTIGKYQFKHQEQPGHRSCTFNCTGEMGMDHCGCLNSSFTLFLLCNEPTKKNHGALLLTAETPFFPQYEPICF